MQMVVIALRSHATNPDSRVNAWTKCCHAWQVTTTPCGDDWRKDPSADGKTDTRTRSCPSKFPSISLTTGATYRHLVLAHWSAFLQHGQQTPISCKPSFGSQRYHDLFPSDTSKLRLSWQSNALRAGCSKIQLLWQPCSAQLAA